MMNVAEILALPLEVFDKVITKDEVSQAAEIATALIEKSLVVDKDGNKLGYDLAEMLEAVHPANNNIIRCDKSDVDFFPDIPETGVWTDVLKDENGEVVLDEDGNAIVTGQRYYYEMGDELTLYDEDPSETEWFQQVDEEAYNKVLLAKRECMACPAQKQCLIWSLTERHEGSGRPEEKPCSSSGRPHRRDPGSYRRTQCCCSSENPEQDGFHEAQGHLPLRGGREGSGHYRGGCEEWRQCRCRIRHY